jgi:hypothetical protein
MSTLEIDVGDIRPVSVDFTADALVVALADGRRIATPLNWYPRLREASAAARGRFELKPMGIHWPELDEDLGIAGMLQGRPPEAIVSLAEAPPTRLALGQPPQERDSLVSTTASAGGRDEEGCA